MAPRRMPDAPDARTDPSTAPLTFRLATAADVPALDALWADDAGWGGLTAAQWRSWYVDTPYGECPVAVAVDADGSAVGQLAFTPARVLVDGAEVPALRLSAPILRRDLRRTLLDATHPVIGMYDAVVHDAVRRGVALVYALPDPAWLGFFGWAARRDLAYADFATAEFACRSRDVRDDVAGVRAHGWTTERVAAFGPEFDAFWDATATGAEAHGGVGPRCAVVRRAAWLTFKHGGAGVRVALRERRAGRLAGYAVVRRSDGLLTDVLAHDAAAYAPLLAGALREVARAHAGGDAIPPHVRALDTPALRPALDQCGFVPVDYRFAFACVPLPGGPLAARVAPTRWHLAGGD